MARYKPYNLKQDKWVPRSYTDQLESGSFEYRLVRDEWCQCGSPC